jgi:hypothetical protein
VDTGAESNHIVDDVGGIDSTAIRTKLSVLCDTHQDRHGQPKYKNKNKKQVRNGAAFNRATMRPCGASTRDSIIYRLESMRNVYIKMLAKFSWLESAQNIFAWPHTHPTLGTHFAVKRNTGESQVSPKIICFDQERQERYDDNNHGRMLD